MSAELAKFNALEKDLVGFIESEEDVLDIVNTINRFMQFPIPSEKDVKLYKDSMKQAQEDLKRRYKQMDVTTGEELGVSINPEDKKQKKLLAVIDTVTSELSTLKELFTVKDKYLKEYTAARKVVYSVGNGVDKIARSVLSINNIINAEEDGKPKYESVNNKIIVSEVMSLLRAEVSLSSLSDMAEIKEIDVTEIRGLDVITDADALKIQKIYDRMFIEMEKVMTQREKISEAIENLRDAKDELDSLNEGIDEVKE